MTIETANYVNQLNTAYPRDTDLLKEGDDHIRMIKNVLKSTFPQFNKTINLTADDLNGMKSNITASATGMTFTKGFTVSGGQSVNFGGNRLGGVGRPGDPNGFNSMDHGEVLTFGHMRSMFRMMYPKGSLFITNGGNPGDLIFFAGTSWRPHWPGRYMMSATNLPGTGPSDTGWQVGNASPGGSTSFSIGAGNLPPHVHGGATDVQGYNQGTSGVGDHQHYEGISLPWNLGTIWGSNGLPHDTGAGIASGGGHNNQGAWTSPQGAHAHTLDWTHRHGFTTDGGQGLNGSPVGYAPSCFGVAVWIRIDDNGVGV